MTYLVLYIQLVFTVIYGVISIKLVQKSKLFEYVRRKAPEGKRHSSIIRGLVLFTIVGIIILLAVVSARYVTDLIKNLGLLNEAYSP
jgi:UDP-N-acetylmuramyl pentapeptide phosphotransferase/UDP-N-acetylglucosamine-1-phosphate transferase